MAFENPLAELAFPFVERQIPVGGLAHLHRFAGEGRARVDEVGDIERRAACLTLVAVGIFIVAARASTDYITVGKKFAGLLVVGLERSLDGELSLVVEVAEEFRSSFMMEFRCGA